MGCWLVFVRDCSRPCNCLSEHPLILNSNPGIAEGDSVIIVDEDSRTPCCMAIANNIKSSEINRESRVYIYLKDCDALSGDAMDRIMRIIRSMNFVIKNINIDKSLCVKY